MNIGKDSFFDDLDRFRLPAGALQVPKEDNDAHFPVRRKQGPGKSPSEFLKGPIPLAWLTAAAKINGKAPLAVALALRFEAGRRKSREVTLTTAILERFDVNRKAKYRALNSLESAGLIRVRRRLRRNPVVTILDLTEIPDCSGSSEAALAATNHRESDGIVGK